MKKEPVKTGPLLCQDGDLLGDDNLRRNNGFFLKFELYHLQVSLRLKMSIFLGI